MSRRSSIPDRFGVEYRTALFAARPRSWPGIALAWVLLDEAYRTDSLTVELGYRLARNLTLMHGQTLERGRDWLIEHGLVSVDSDGRGRNARTEWTLEIPPLARVFLGPWNDRVSADIKSLEDGS